MTTTQAGPRSVLAETCRVKWLRSRVSTGRMWGKALEATVTTWAQAKHEKLVSTFKEMKVTCTWSRWRNSVKDEAGQLIYVLCLSAQITNCDLSSTLCSFHTLSLIPVAREDFSVSSSLHVWSVELDYKCLRKETMPSMFFYVHQTRASVVHKKQSWWFCVALAHSSSACGLTGNFLHKQRLQWRSQHP